VADATRHAGLPVVVALGTRVAAGRDELHVLAALPYPSGVTLALAVATERVAGPLWSLAPRGRVDAHRARGRDRRRSGHRRLLRRAARVERDLVLEPDDTPGGSAIWLAPLPATGSIRLRLRSGAVEGDWVEIDTGPLREAAARAVDLWTPFVDHADGLATKVSMAEGPFELTEPFRCGPPVNVLGRTLAVQEIVAQDDANALVVGPLRAFPNGFSVEAAALARASDLRAVFGLDIAESLRRDAADVVRLAVTDASRREWTTEHDADVRDHDLREHVVRAVHWFRGRPVAGPLTLRATWPRAGLDGAVVVDGRELLRLAATCEDLLP
jgi:hypothetical protein